MAKGAVIALLVSACVLLALASQAEAQCRPASTGTLQQCLGSIQSNSCQSQCRTALQPYADQSAACICQLVAQAVNIGGSLGVTKAKVTALIQKCGQAAPNCR